MKQSVSKPITSSKSKNFWPSVDRIGFSAGAPCLPDEAPRGCCDTPFRNSRFEVFHPAVTPNLPDLERQVLQPNSWQLSLIQET